LMQFVDWLNFVGLQPRLALSSWLETLHLPKQYLLSAACIHQPADCKVSNCIPLTASAQDKHPCQESVSPLPRSYTRRLISCAFKTCIKPALTRCGKLTCDPICGLIAPHWPFHIYPPPLHAEFMETAEHHCLRA
jgi:hypothetical protein